MAKDRAARAPRRKIARLEKKLDAAVKLQDKRRRQLGDAESAVAAIAARIAKLQPPEAAPNESVVIAAAAAEPASVVENPVGDNGATPPLEAPAGQRKSRKVPPAPPN